VGGCGPGKLDIGYLVCGGGGGGDDAGLRRCGSGPKDCRKVKGGGETPPVAGENGNGRLVRRAVRIGVFSSASEGLGKPSRSKSASFLNSWTGGGGENGGMT
jgi:hypothetical protein